MGRRASFMSFCPLRFILPITPIHYTLQSLRNPLLIGQNMSLIESSCKDGPYPSLSWILSYAPTDWIPANYHIVVARRWHNVNVNTPSIDIT